MDEKSLLLAIEQIIGDKLAVERKHMAQLMDDTLAAERDQIAQLMDDTLAAEREHISQLMDDKLAVERSHMAQLMDERFAAEREYTWQMIAQQISPVNTRLDKMQEDISVISESLSEVRVSVGAIFDWIETPEPRPIKLI